MKLAAFALVTTLGLGAAGTAHEDPPARPRGQLHQLLLERFDRNHDGRLDPQERRRAIRALRRLARRMATMATMAPMARQEGRAERGARGTGPEARRDARIRSMVERYDQNGDGVVTPDEMPPGMARRLQRLDRNGDGWLDDRDQP